MSHDDFPQEHSAESPAPTAEQLQRVRMAIGAVLERAVRPGVECPPGTPRLTTELFGTDLERDDRTTGYHPPRRRPGEPSDDELIYILNGEVVDADRADEVYTALDESRGDAALRSSLGAVFEGTHPRTGVPLHVSVSHLSSVDVDGKPALTDWDENLYSVSVAPAEGISVERPSTDFVVAGTRPPLHQSQIPDTDPTTPNELMATSAPDLSLDEIISLLEGGAGTPPAPQP